MPDFSDTVRLYFLVYAVNLGEYVFIIIHVCKMEGSEKLRQGRQIYRRYESRCNASLS